MISKIVLLHYVFDYETAFRKKKTYEADFLKIFQNKVIVKISQNIVKQFLYFSRNSNVPVYGLSIVVNLLDKLHDTEVHFDQRYIAKAEISLEKLLLNQPLHKFKTSKSKCRKKIFPRAQKGCKFGRV